MANAALGYATILDYINPSDGCSGEFYSRSFAMGICVDQNTTSNIYTYDGTTITNTVFNQVGCVGVATTNAMTPGDCMSASSNNAAHPEPMYSTIAYNAILPSYTDEPGVDSLGFSNSASCSSGGYIQSVNWFPLNQCMWFEFYGQYIKFTSCTSQASTVSFDGTAATVERTTYSDSSCSSSPVSSSFSDDCSVPTTSEPILLESYLTQCSSQCTSATTSALGSSTTCDSNTSQVNATLGLTTTIFIMMVVFLFLKAYGVFFKQPTYNGDRSQPLNKF